MRRPRIVEQIIQYAEQYREPFKSTDILMDFKNDGIYWTPKAVQIGLALKKSGYEIVYYKNHSAYWTKKKSETLNKSDSNY